VISDSNKEKSQFKPSTLSNSSKEKREVATNSSGQTHPKQDLRKGANSFEQTHPKQDSLKVVTDSSGQTHPKQDSRKVRSKSLSCSESEDEPKSKRPRSSSTTPKYQRSNTTDEIDWAYTSTEEQMKADLLKVCGLTVVDDDLTADEKGISYPCIDKDLSLSKFQSFSSLQGFENPCQTPKLSKKYKQQFCLINRMSLVLTLRSSALKFSKRYLDFLN
jgi:hypothetical protein